MKKSVIILCAVAIIASVFASAKEIEQLIANIVSYKIVVDGVEASFQKPVVSINGTTYVPIRELCENLGIDLNWNEEEKAVVINTDDEMNCDNWTIFNEKGVYNQGDSKYGYMDKTGKIKIPAQFDYAYDFKEGLAVVYMYPSGKGVVLPDSIEPYGMHGFINAKGEYVFSHKGFLSDFSNGLAVVHDKEGKYVINHKLEKVFGVDFVAVGPFSEGYAPVKTKGTAYPSPLEGKWSFINMTGKLATDQEFEEVREFSEGMAVVKNNGKWGAIDSRFNLVIDYQYDNAQTFTYGLLAVEKNGKWGYVDRTGKVIIDFVYDNAFIFASGLASVSLNDKCGFINTKGEIVIPFKFEYTKGFFEGLSAVQENGKYGYINMQGKYVIKPIYSKAFSFKNGLARVRSDTKEITYHYINKKGERVDPHK